MYDDTSFLGVRDDTRPQEVKDKDVHIRELVASFAPVVWVEKTDDQIRKFTDRDQTQSSSCVGQTVAKLAEVSYFLKTGEKVVFSATSIYAPRSNKPELGMIPAEAMTLWKEKGITLEQLLKSQNLNENQINNVPITNLAKDTATLFKIDNFVQLPIDIEVIAGTIQQTGKAVALLVRFASKEWSREFPVIMGGEAPLGHEIAVTDFTLRNGKKCLVIEDSAHFGGLTRRYLSEDFLVRAYNAYYAANFRNLEEDRPSDKPKYFFKKSLKFIPLNIFGDISDLLANELQKTDVIMLQNILKYEGFFPTNIASTGYYGAKTCQAVQAFQIKHQVATLDVINQLEGKSVGPATVAMLNKLYS
jgi:hypothetical protein